MRLSDLAEKNLKEAAYKGSLLAFDPGETTGYAFFDAYVLLDYGQFTMYHDVEILLDEHKPDLLVVENFVLYPWKAKELSWDEMVAPQVIGVIKYLAELREVPVVLQKPSLPKRFFDNNQLKRLELYPKGKRHAADAIRHGAYYVIFGGGSK